MSEVKTILKAFTTVDSKLPSLPREDGQLIFVYDKKKIVLDIHGIRTVYEQIQTLEKEEHRQSLLAPIDSFYFVIETSILWRYTNGKWIQNYISTIRKSRRRRFLFKLSYCRAYESNLY